MTLVTHLVHYVVNGQKLKAIRRGKEWTQSDVASKLGVHKETIHRLEAGRGGSLSLVRDLCQLYEIPYRSVVRLKRLPDGRGRHVERREGGA